MLLCSLRGRLSRTVWAEPALSRAAPSRPANPVLGGVSLSALRTR